MNRKKIVLAIAFIAIMAGLAAGPSAEKQTNELRFIDVSPSPTRQEYFTNTFDKFEQETGIKVVYESVPW
nr:sugar ABC transporter substrate-binding protein [Spirochaetota bacterium]